MEYKLIDEISLIINSPIVNKILIGLVITGLIFIFRCLKKIYREIRYFKILQYAMDYALEKSISNGYAEHRDMKRDELINKDKYIEKI